jgi:hypothetical protein
LKRKWREATRGVFQENYNRKKHIPGKKPNQKWKTGEIKIAPERRR